MSVFDEMGVYWEEIAKESQTAKQIEFLTNMLKPEGYILDIACGTGRHSTALLMAGFSMVGFDVSLNLLRIAKARCGELQVIRGDMRFLPFKPKAFSAAISMDTSIGYLPSIDEDLVSLKDAARTLKQDGTLIVDVFNRRQLQQKQGQGAKKRVLFWVRWMVFPVLLRFNRRLLVRLFKWREYPSFFLLQKRSVNADSGVLCDLWLVHDKASGEFRLFRHGVRLYGFDELQGLLERAGFLIKHVYGGYGRQRFSVDSSQLIFVLGLK